MVVVPGTLPVTTPPPDIVALLGALLVHAPPGEALLNVIVPPPAHTPDGPEIEGGRRFTTTLFTEEQPVAVKVYDIFATPNATPVTTPVVAPTVASDGSELLHVPPGVAFVIGVVAPVHALEEPTIGAGGGLTVINAIAEDPPQGLACTCIIVTVPTATPVTTPEDDTVAIEGSLDVHTPGAVAALVKVILLPTHTDVGPSTAPGSVHNCVIFTYPLPT